MRDGDGGVERFHLSFPLVSSRCSEPLLNPAVVAALGRHHQEAQGFHRIGVELLEDLGELQTAGAVPEGPSREEHDALS